MDVLERVSWNSGGGGWGFEEVVVVYVGLGGVGETTSSRHWGVDASLDGLEEGASV